MSLAKAAVAAAVATVAIVSCTTPQFDNVIGERLDDGSLVVGAGVTDGRRWISTAKVSERSLCLAFVENGDDELFGCVPLVAVTDADITFAVTDGRAESVAGSTEAQVAFVELVTRDGSWRAPVVSLRPLGLAASAYGVMLPSFPAVVRARLLDSAGNVLDDAGP